ncbi:CBS domain-containing protein CBSX1 [Populus alba x Populus x berolinensis]|nr:CBS domain-containing protein CBSX1 [Populus alba x Populus x berolinensis]KAJ6990269.1 CBS domain-containing protein CBSX1 [Populus alba x Populus x berolinensis]
MDASILLHPSSLFLTRLRASTTASAVSLAHQMPCLLFSPPGTKLVSLSSVSCPRRSSSFIAAASSGTLMANSPKNGVYTVGDFMTRKEDLQVVKPTTTVDEALESLVEHRITGFPVIDDDWKLVGLVSDYDLLALDSISGGGRTETNMFPEVDSTWKTFNEVQRLLSKTNGKVVGDLMTPAPVVVRETTNLEDAARLLLETKYRRLPVVDADGKLVGIITRGNVVRAALHIKRDIERKAYIVLEYQAECLDEIRKCLKTANQSLADLESLTIFCGYCWTPFYA